MGVRVLLFVAAMLLGMLLFEALERRDQMALQGLAHKLAVA